MNARDYFYGMLPEEERPEILLLSTTAELLEQCKSKYAHDAAVNDFKNELDYSQLYDEVGRLRGALAAKGLEPGGVVGLFFRNDADFIKLFLAVTSFGAVAVPFPVQMPPQAVAGTLMKYGAAMLLHADEFSPLFAESPVKAIAASAIGEGGYMPAGDIDKDTDCAIFFTGGTTGRPKGALLTHGAIMRGAFNGTFIPVHVLRQRYYAIIPFSHIFGVVRNLLTCLYTGSVMYTCTDMKKIFADLPVAKPTILVLVPALADMLLGVVSMRGLDALGGRLKVIISGAAPVPPGLMYRYHELGICLMPGYGLTESANLVSGNAEPLKYPDSVGFTYADQEFKLVDNELWIKGANMFKEYYRDPEETAAAFEDGWFKTGDLARFDEDGRLYITGRKKNIIILGNGENVSPEELELLLYKLPIVKDCLVKEYTNDAGFAMIAAEILPNMPVMQKMGITDPAKALDAEVEKINSTLPTYMRIAKVILRDTDFERSPSMKIVRK